MPILRTEDDTLGRGAFVETLGNIVMHAGIADQDHATFIGVYGGWGEGKTSVRNLLESHLRAQVGDKGVIFVDFCPWQYGETCDFRLKLCEKLEIAIGRAHKGTPARVFSQLVKLATFKSPNRTPGVLGEFLDVFREFWFSSILKEDDLFGTLKSVLREMSQTTRIVVVVDDLDRVTREETARVIRFLKSTGDLPNLVYLILADEDYLANAVVGALGMSLEKSLEGGRAYLRKIVGIRCPLPQISQTALAAHFTGEVRQLVAGYGLEWCDETQACEWAAECLKTLRDEKLLLNEYSAMLAVLKHRAEGKMHLGVHLGDLLALTAIRSHAPDCFKHLQRVFYAVLESYSFWKGVSSKSGVSAEWMEDHFFKLVRSGEREWIATFLSNRLGIVPIEFDEASQKPLRYGLLDNTHDAEDMSSSRLASEFHFASYFHFDNETTAVLDEGLTAFKRSILKGDIPEKLLADLEKRGLWPQLLDSLTGDTSWPPTSACDSYVRTLVHMAGMPHQTMEDESQRDSVGRAIYRCLALYAKNMHNGAFSKMAGHRHEPLLPVWTSAFLKAVQTENDVQLTAAFLGHEAHYRPNGHPQAEALFDEKSYQELKAGFLKRMPVFQRGGKLMGHTDFPYLFIRWMNEATDEEARRDFRLAMAPELENLDSAWKILMCFWAQEYHEHEPGIWPIHMDWLEKAFGEDGIQKLAKTLAPLASEDGPRGKTVRLLKWALIAKSKGEPFDEDAQSKHLLAGDRS